jgi:hypothetical protein
MRNGLPGTEGALAGMLGRNFGPVNSHDDSNSGDETSWRVAMDRYSHLTALCSPPDI